MTALQSTANLQVSVAMSGFADLGTNDKRCVCAEDAGEGKPALDRSSGDASSVDGRCLTDSKTILK